jgi:hypothetical protein
VGGYNHHPLLERPSADATLWRYMDVARFIDLIDRRALYFARVDQMEDPWEGTLGERGEEENMEAIAAGLPPHITSTASAVEAVRKDYRRFRAQYRTRMYLSCWVGSEVESAAMWRIYTGRDGLGVAIETTFERFERALPAEYPHEIVAGRVRYIDYRSESPQIGNAYAGYVCKRLSFRHEQEVRALIYTHGEELDKVGLIVPVDLATLVRHVHVAPTAPEWYEDVVRRAAERYGLDAPVTRSDLYAGPLV